MNRTDNPKVFISYSWSSQAHKDWVRQEIAEALIKNGIDVILDQWDLREGNDSYAFMEKMVNDPTISKVLIITDKQYCLKCNSRKGGVGTEAMIISPEVYNNVEQEKFIPIVTEYDESGLAFLPTYLKGKIYIDFSNKVNFFEEFEKLLRNIVGKPLHKKSPLGSLPIFEDTHQSKTLKIFHIKNSIKDVVVKSNKAELYLLENYMNSFLDSLEEYRLGQSEINDEYDAIFMQNLQELKILRDDFIEVTEFCITSIDNTRIYNLFFSFFERLIAFKFPPDFINQWNEIWFDNYSFFMYELFIYFITILIKNEKYDEVNLFTEDFYYNDKIRLSFDQVKWKYYVFFSHNKTLEEYRKNKLKLNWKSETARVIEERATLKNYHFNMLMQTDFLLFLKFIFSFNDYENSTLKIWEWPPVLLNHAERIKGFEMFLRAENKKNFEKIKILLNVKDKSELREKWNKANSLLEIDKFDPYRRVSLGYFLNFDSLYNS